MKSFALVLAVCLVQIMTGTSARAAEKPTKYFLKQLRGLTPETAAYPRVKRLVLILAKMAPEKAALYYKVGLSEIPLSPLRYQYRVKLAKEANRVVEKSELPPDTKRKVLFKIDIYASIPEGYQA